MKNFTDHERATIARAWPVSGLTQAIFAAQHNISDRALRAWTRRYASRQPPLDRARGVVRDAVEQLQAVLASLDTEALAGCRAQSQDPEPGAGNAETASRPTGEKQACRTECSRCDHTGAAEPCPGECQSGQVAPPTASAAPCPEPGAGRSPAMPLCMSTSTDSWPACTRTWRRPRGSPLRRARRLPRRGEWRRVKVGGFFSR